MVNISLMIGVLALKSARWYRGEKGKGKGKSSKFVASVKDTHRQIGNAVPTPLAEALGREIRKAIKNNIWWHQYFLLLDIFKTPPTILHQR